MIKYNFNRVFKARGIEKPFSYLAKAGFSQKFATKIKNDRVARLNMNVLEKLCILLRCTPNDLLEWIQEKDVQLDSAHPLQTLKRSEKVIDITKMLNSIPIEYLEDIETVIADKVKTYQTKH